MREYVTWLWCSTCRTTRKFIHRLKGEDQEWECEGCHEIFGEKPASPTPLRTPPFPCEEDD